MNMFKKIGLSVLAAVAIIFTAYAVDQSDSISAAGINSEIQGKIHLTSLEVINNAAGSVTVYFYDAPTNLLTFVVGQYTNFTTYTTNIVITTTNYNGVVETSTNLATFTTPRTVAQSTNNYKLFKTMTVASGGDVTWQPLNGVYLSYGMTSTNNNTNIIVNTTYSSTR